jgi:hypothetical protein
MIVSCPECNGKLSTGASRCPHCGYEATSCPECGAKVSQQKEFCPDCGYRLKEPAPVQSSRPHGRAKIRNRYRTASGIHQEGPEPPGALVCAILGLFIPILSAIGLVLSRRGSAAQILSIIGLVLWVFWLLLVLTIGASVRQALG